MPSGPGPHNFVTCTHASSPRLMWPAFKASKLLIAPVFPLASHGKMMHCKHRTLRPV